MADPALPLPSPQARGRRKLVALMEALRPLGLNATVTELATALIPLKEGRWGIRISAEMLETIQRDVQHQSLINATILAGLKRQGYDTTYRDLYPEYVEACGRIGVKPFTLKTFQNRALQRQARWERNLNKTVREKV